MLHMNKIDYDIINNFHINDNNYLFFDIFLKNSEIVMICPVYDSVFDECNITLYNNLIPIKQKCIFKRIHDDPTEQIVVIINMK